MKLAADRETGVPETPIEPAVEVRLTVPVAAMRFNPPAKLEALEILFAEFRVIELVLATVPTDPASPSEPVVAVNPMSVPVIAAAAFEFKFPAAVMLNVPPAPELLLTTVVPALESLM